MEISRTKIKAQLRRKKKPELAETIISALKNKPWLAIAKTLSSPSRNMPSVNLQFIEDNSKVGDTIVIPGKVLSVGEVSKKIRVCAVSFSAPALEKLKKSKSEAVLLSEEIKKNPKA